MWTRVRDSPFDMPAVGRSRLLLAVVPVLLGVVLFVAGGRADAQTGTTTPSATTPASAAPTTTASAGDSASTRTVNRIVAGLIALAALLAGTAIWFWRA